MKRITITIDDEIGTTLRKIQARLIEKFDKDISFTTIVNFVLFAGISGSEDFSEETWGEISKYLHEEQPSLDKEGLTDNYDNQLK